MILNILINLNKIIKTFFVIYKHLNAIFPKEKKNY